MIYVNSVNLDKKYNPNFKANYTLIGKKLYSDGKPFSGKVKHNLKSGKLLMMKYYKGMLSQSQLYKMEEVQDVKPPFKGLKYFQMVTQSLKRYFYEPNEKLVRVTKGDFDVFKIKRQMNLTFDVHHTDIVSGDRQMRIYDWNNELVRCVFPRNKIFSMLEHTGDILNETRYKITDNKDMQMVGNITIDGKQHFLEPNGFLSQNTFSHEHINTFFDSEGKVIRKTVNYPQNDFYIEHNFVYDNHKNLVADEIRGKNNEYLGGEIWHYDEKNILREHIEVIEGDSSTITKFDKDGNVTEHIIIPKASK